MENSKASPLETFIKSFWEARRLTQKSRLNDSEQAYQLVADEARRKRLYDEALLADAAAFELKGRYDDAIRLLDQVVKNLSGASKGVAHFMLGSVYKERFQENTDKAIEHYNAAVKVAEFDKKAWAYNNLGNIYFRCATLLKPDNPDDAQQQKAVKEKKAKLLEKAKKNYAEGLELNKDDITRYITIYNLGRLELTGDKKENYEAAIARFSQAIDIAADDYDMHGCCYREMGTAYIHIAIAYKGQSFHDAIRCWENASHLLEKAEMRAGEDLGRLGKSAVVLAKIRIAKHYRDRLNKMTRDDEVLLKWWPPEESGADGYSTPEERIFSMIEATGRDRYRLYNTRSSSRFASRKKETGETCPKNVLAVLRGWGSASPLIEDALSACVGGGYFLKWRDKGIIIDPGIDFMRNFRAAGFHMREVDAVIVSHNHTDHNTDLRPIDDVFYELFRRADEDTPGEIERNWHYYLICDEETKGKDFLRINTDKQQVKRSAASKARQAYLSHRTIIDLYEKQPEKEEHKINLRDKGLPFIINSFPARHNIPAYSFRIECLSEDGTPALNIGFTCDTEYFKELEDHFKEDEARNIYNKCDILVAHVSQPDLVELLSSNPTKRNHLGYRGVAKLIKGCKPRLTILGEFWAGFADMRIDITKGLKRICGDADILPSSVGLFVSPQDHSHDCGSNRVLEIECSNCRKWRSVSSIYVGAASNEFGPLAYLCSFCRI